MKTSAYILIKTAPGKEKDVLNHLDQNLKTKHKELVFGGYDIVMRLSADSSEEIQKVVMEKVKSYKDVAGVLVLNCVKMPA
jgi:DNA-binding Lrp family transcriptional regulator